MKRKLAHGTSGRGRIGAAAWSRTPITGGSAKLDVSCTNAVRAAAVISKSSGSSRSIGGCASLSGTLAGSAGRAGARPQAARDTGGSENALTNAFDKIWYTASLAARGSANRTSAFCGCTFTSTSSGARSMYTTPRG